MIRPHLTIHCCTCTFNPCSANLKVDIIKTMTCIEDILNPITNES